MEEKEEQTLSNKIEIQSDDGLNSSNSQNETLPSQYNDNLNATKDVLITNNSNDTHTNRSCENEEKLNLKVRHQCSKCSRHKHHGNIGANIVLFNKYVFGPKNFLWLLITIVLGMFASFYFWVYAMGDYYPKYVYYLLHIPFLTMQLLMFVSFSIEPGIIPRNHPDFKINEEEDKEKENSDNKDKDKEKTEEEKKVETTPRIFTLRKCPTCNILRPPGASHCRVCNNCVLGFDHHCSFISNCVGKRNHKSFCLLLTCAATTSVSCAILNIIVIINVYFIHFKDTFLPIYRANKWILFLSLALLIMSGLQATNVFPNFCLIISLGLSSLGLFIYAWREYLPNNETTPSYYNPYLIISLMIAFGFVSFGAGNLMGQLFNISRGITFKQSLSINEKIHELESTGYKIDYVYSRHIPFTERIKNVIAFLLTKREKSLIVPERDLIEK